MKIYILNWSAPDNAEKIIYDYHKGYLDFDEAKKEGDRLYGKGFDYSIFPVDVVE